MRFRNRKETGLGLALGLFWGVTGETPKMSTITWSTEILGSRHHVQPHRRQVHSKFLDLLQSSLAELFQVLLYYCYQVF